MGASISVPGASKSQGQRYETEGCHQRRHEHRGQTVRPQLSGSVGADHALLVDGVLNVGQHHDRITRTNTEDGDESRRGCRASGRPVATIAAMPPIGQKGKLISTTAAARAAEGHRQRRHESAMLSAVRPAKPDLACALRFRLTGKRNVDPGRQLFCSKALATRSFTSATVSCNEGRSGAPLKFTLTRRCAPSC